MIKSTPALTIFLLLLPLLKFGTGEVRLLSETPTSVQFELVTDTIILTADRTNINLPGADRIALPGEPDLPGKIVFVGVPQKGTVQLQVAFSETEGKTDVEIPPAPALDEKPVTPGTMFQKDEFWPPAPAELSSVETIRGIRVARVRLNPVRYNPVRKKALIYRRLNCVLSFSVPAEETPQPDPLNPVLNRLLINGKTAVSWKSSGPAKDSFNFFHRFGVWCQIKTETTGIYKITPADLKSAGFEPATIDPRTFRLYTIGRYPLNGPYPDTMIETPISVSGQEDGKFDPQDYILFYARAPSSWDDSLNEWQTNYYTRYRVFWLTWGSDAGKRMSELIATNVTNPQNRAPTRLRLEEDKLCPARSGLLWVWERYSNVGAVTATFYRELNLPHRDTLKKLRLCFYARSERNSETYRALISLNNTILDTVLIAATNQNCPPNTFVFETIPPGAAALGDKKDTLSVTLLGSSDVYLDYIEADYIQNLKLEKNQPAFEFYTPQPGDFSILGAKDDLLIFDVTNPLEPRRVHPILSGNEARFRSNSYGVFFATTSARFRNPVSIRKRNPGTLRTPPEKADYYLVCPDEFLPVARIFARFRDGNLPGITGARVKEVSLSEIYDDYAFGMEEPGAIKTFFAAKQPAYGLLLGDATYDYKDNLNLGKRPGVPTYEIGFDLDYEVYNPYVKALDAWFADFDGGGSSPDMILGRVTCRTPQELRQFIEKVKSYETQELGLWAKRFLLLADDEYLGEPSKKEGTIHIEGCERIEPLAGTSLDIVKVYLTEYPLEGIKSKPKAEAELLRQLNRGALFWCFFGHGAGFQLCHERAFNIEDVPLVHNGNRNPLAFFGSCGVGRFDDTKYEAIAEELVRTAEGCIATIGASKATYSGSNENFAHKLFSRLLLQPEEPVGPAFYEAWFQSNLYILFGDPATKVRLPQPGGMIVSTPDTFYPGAPVRWQISAPMNRGYYELRATEAARERYYFSDAANITYTLPGQEIFRGIGSFPSDTFYGSLIVPNASYPDTVVVGNGRYVRKRETCRISALIWRGSEAKTLLSPPYLLSTEAVSTSDTLPPELTLRADNVLLKQKDTTRIQKRFNLHGTVTDPSGVFLMPDPAYGLKLYLTEPSKQVMLDDYFSYNDNSTTTGKFNYPVNLEQNFDSLIVVVSDNHLNRRIATYYLKTDLRDQLRIDTCLVYPNPLKDRAVFTFILSRPARVTIKIFTISGRLLRIIEPRECGFGYNQIEWDGCDQDGLYLPNGIYLYKIDAQAGETITGNQLQTRSTSYRDKIIVHR
ncbi:MAG: C25 family cysteine peptidase [bacterium]